MQYYVPGFIFVKIFCFCAVKEAHSNFYTLYSCVVSFVEISLIRTIVGLFSNTEYNSWAYVTIGAATSIILGALLSAVFKSKSFDKFLVDFFNISPSKNIWQTHIDYRNGSNIKVKLKGSEGYIIGHYKSHDNLGNDSWFTLTQAHHYISNKEDPEAPDSLIYIQSDSNAYFCFCLSEVEYLEIFN